MTTTTNCTETLSYASLKNYAEIYKDACKAGNYTFTIRIIEAITARDSLGFFYAILQDSE